MTHGISGSDFLEMVEWINDRFTPGWTPDRAAAYAKDLKAYKPEDIWDAIYRLYDRGLEYAPTGSQVKKEVTVVVKDRMMRARQEAQGLPAMSNTDMGWRAWRARLGYSGMTFQQAIEKRHQELWPNGCPWLCGLCGNVAA